MEPRSHRIVLASASPRRVQLLRDMGVGEFEVAPGTAEELHDERLAAADLAMLNAERKARSVSDRFPDALVLGADTLVVLDGKFFGKPGDLEEAGRMLEELAGQTHEVVTGVCLVHERRGTVRRFAESTCVKFRTLTRDQIQQYLASINPLDKAGAYAIQEGGERIVETVTGSFSNVVGLPTERLAKELKELGL